MRPISLPFVRSGPLPLLVLLVSLTASSAQVVTFSSSAGYAGQGNANGVATGAQFSEPAGVAMDSAGNLYVADSGNDTIRKITSGGVVSILAGTPGVAGSVDGPAASASFNQPIGLAVDGAGNVYVADAGNNTIREITSARMVITLAGKAGTPGSTNGMGTDALFNQPQGIALDAATNLYVADYGNHTIRLITPALAVTTYAGTPGTFGSTDGNVGSALFYQPQGVAVDGSFNVYVTDTANGTVRKITQAGTVSTLAGLAGNLGSSDGIGTNAQFYQPEGIVLDEAANLYVADNFNQTIRKITPGGVVSTLAGSPGIAGSANGVTKQARFWCPLGLAVDGATNLYVADYFNGTIRELAPAGVVTLYAGTPSAGSLDGPNSNARFNLPLSTAVDGLGNIYVADSVNSTIRKITAGQVTTFAGFPGSFGSIDGPGTNAVFNGPEGMAVDAAGNIYVADTLNDTVRKIFPAGAVVTLAGFPGFPGNEDGQGTNAEFSHPTGIALDKSNNIYVADSVNNTIRKITPAGLVSTLAGLSGYAGDVDGTNSAVRFNSPRGVALDGSGNIYVADYNNNLIRELTPAGQSSTLVGLGGVWGSADGTNSAARFFGPAGVAVDGSGNIYVADSGNHTLRLLTPSGTNWVVSTIAGLPGTSGTANGTGDTALFDFPTGIALDATNGVYVADSLNNEVRIQADISAPIPIFNINVVPRPASAIVSWSTPTPATTQVAYGLTPGLGNLTTLNPALATNHAVLLTGLETNSTYYYAVISTAANAAGATNGSFSTSLNIIVESPQAVYAGPWIGDSSGVDRYSPVYEYAATAPAAPVATATFMPAIVTPAQYDVYLWYSEGSNRSVAAPLVVNSQSVSFFTSVNETLPGGSWQLVAGDQSFAGGESGDLVLGNGTGETNKIVIADAVMFAYTPGQDVPVNGQIPAWWLNFYFGTTNENSATLAANGLSLLADYVLGISPNDPNTVLNFGVTFEPDGFQASFSPAVNGRIYQLQSTMDLGSQVWVDVPGQVVTEANGQGSITGANVSGATIFYRLSVNLAP